MKRDRNCENESFNEIENNQNRKKGSGGGSYEKSENNMNKIDENDVDSIFLSGKIIFLLLFALLYSIQLITEINLCLNDIRTPLRLVNKTQLYSFNYFHSIIFIHEKR